MNRKQFTSFIMGLAYVLMIQVHSFANPKIDPIRFSIGTTATQVSLNEEFEIKISAKYLNIPSSVAFVFEGSNSFKLKLIVPEGFVQTGGDFHDFTGAELTKSKPTATYTVRGKFVSSSDNGTFQLLRSHKNSDNQSTFVEVGRLSFTLKEGGDIAANDPAARIMLSPAPAYVPYMTMAQLRVGLADTAKVVYITEGPRSGIFLYQPQDSLSTDDSAIYLVTGTRRYKRQYSGAVNVAWFGIVPDYDTTSKTGSPWYDTFQYSIVNKGYKNIFFPKGNYSFGVFPPVNNSTISGEVGTAIYFKFVNTPVFLQFGNNTILKNIKFQSTEADLENSRADISNVTNVSIENCGFINFKNPSKINSWGLYIKNSKNVRIDNCYFGGNSQSDIAILEGSEDVTVINPVNNIDPNGIHLNVEPNVSPGVRGLTVIGGVYRQINLLESSFVAYGNRNINFLGVKAKMLVYDGAEANFHNCTIDDVLQESKVANYAGALNINVRASNNLIEDPSIVDVMHNGANTFWTTHTAANFNVDRIKDSDGIYTRINYLNVAQQFIIQSRNFINISGGKKLMIIANSRAIIPSEAAWISQNLQIVYYDSLNTLIETDKISINRGQTNSRTPFLNHVAFSSPPERAAKVKIFIGNMLWSSVASDWKALGLFEIENSLGQGESIESLFDRITKNNNYSIAALPVNASSPRYFVGDEVQLTTISNNLPSRYVCITEGKPAVFTPSNMLGKVTSYLTNVSLSAPTKTSLNGLYGGLKSGSIITYPSISSGGREYRKLSDDSTSDWVQTVWTTGVKSLAL
ncbi:hypothetical protein [Dyadobacter sp. CY312]|uniref:hypothetical protein n=1 Tax=Dyadobacter sp. CY312 TaxID=2907303 RepID=UPI001F1AAA75|nr:hypothetical protein [Dyadobacter sp. CY312]MCE7039007.1 hypothetical protein [Dyadobacter sp. CY312]